MQVVLCSYVGGRLMLNIRYSGMHFLSGLWVLGFNPLSLDLAFIQIPFLEQVSSFDRPLNTLHVTLMQPGICFSSDCGEGTRSAIARM